MNEGFLLDENLPRWWRPSIQQLQPHLRVWHVGDPGVPPFGTQDPEILRWCERNNFYLVTNNRHSMPGHLADHVTAGGHVPGIFVVNPTRSIVVVATELSEIEGAALPNEFQDSSRQLPLT